MQNFKSLALFLLLICLSCDELDVEDNLRLVYTGNLIDENNQPLQNVKLSTTFETEDNFSEFDNILGQGFTDANGKFEFVSLLSDSFEGGLEIIPENINPNPEVQDQYADIFIAFTNDVLQNVNHIEINDLKIPKKAVLEVDIQKTSVDPLFLEWTLEYINPRNFIEITEVSQLNDLTSFDTFSAISGQNTSENTDDNFDRESIINSTAIFIYSINNEPNQVIEIPINNSTNVFQFTY